MIDWGTVSTAVIAVVTAGGTIGGVAVGMIRHSLRASFATLGQFNTLSERVLTVEQQIRQMPNHQDIAVLGARLGDVERGVAVAREAIVGVKEGLSRVEHMMGLLLQAQLDNEKAQKS
jgi:hypothetical protein